VWWDVLKRDFLRVVNYFKEETFNEFR
jgi:hypothetical protein